LAEQKTPEKLCIAVSGWELTQPGERPRSMDIRNLLDGLFYLLRTGF
jgi:hypothetical protein